MFTGIVEELGAVRAVTPNAGGARIEIIAKVVLDDAELGDSIAVNGCCLTVVELLDDGWARRRGHRDPRPHLARRRSPRATRSTSNVRCGSPTASVVTSCRATSTASARCANASRCPTAPPA